MSIQTWFDAISSVDQVSRLILDTSLYDELTLGAGFVIAICLGYVINFLANKEP